jgi:hypothetical protein
MHNLMHEDPPHAKLPETLKKGEKNGKCNRTH